MSTTTRSTEPIEDDDPEAALERMRKRTDDPWLERVLELAQSGSEEAS